MKEYFSHDLGARHDKKIIALVNKHKSSGYGIFWATNEMMHEEGGELELDQLTYDAIAKQLNELTSHIQVVINDCINVFHLYIIDNQRLTSNRVRKNLTGSKERKQAKIEIGRLGGIKSGESRRSKQNEATLQANEALLEATNQRKGKERKGKESIVNSSVNDENDSICLDAEAFILNNTLIFEKICIATLKGADEVKRELHNYHLWLTKNEKYPTVKKVVIAGIESWILNAKNYKSRYNIQEDSNGATSIPHNLKKLNP